MSCIREYIRRKWSRRQGAVPETAHVFEVGKELQVLVQKFVVERAVEIFTVHWGHCRCESGEVKELLRPRQTGERHRIAGHSLHLEMRVGVGDRAPPLRLGW